MMVTDGVAQTIRVLLVDDHAIVREGTKAVLSRVPDIELVGEAESGEDAVTLAERFRPDVVLMDIKLKGQNGVEAARQLRILLPGIKIIALTAYDFEPYIKAMMRIGAEGYLLKDSPSNQIIDGIRTVSRGGTVLSASVAQRLVAGYLNNGHLIGARPVDALTEREGDVLRLLAEGKKNAEIGEALHVSVSTVEAHITGILGKLGARSRTEAVGIAVKRGLVVLEP